MEANKADLDIMKEKAIEALRAMYLIRSKLSIMSHLS